MTVRWLTSLKTIRSIFQKVPTSEALNAIKTNPTKGKSDLFNWERDSCWDLVASIRDHHQLLSPQNHLLWPGMSWELFSISIPVLTSPTPVFTPSQGLGFPHKSLTSSKSQLSSFCDRFLQHFLALGRHFVAARHSFVRLCGFPGLQPPAQAGTFPVQAHLAVTPQGMERSTDLSRLYLTYRKWRITHHLLHMLCCT